MSEQNANPVELFGMRVAHVGINATDPADALEIAELFSTMMGLPVIETPVSYFNDSLVEIMKQNGRGAKGQTKRNHVRPGFEGGQLPLYMRLPKLRGFKNPFKVEFQVINIARLVEFFPEGGEVAVADLIAKGAVRDNAPVKVLGDGETTVAFTLKGVKASASAKSKIEAAGGSVSED